jgi:ATP-binding cassette subfamily B protein
MLSSRKNLASLNGFTQESLTSLSAVKLLNAEEGVSRRYHTLNTAYRNAQLENVFYDSLMFSTIDGISSITLGIALFISIRASGLGDDLTAGTLIAFIQYIQQLFEPLKQLGTKMAMLQGAFTSVERIFGLLDRGDRVQGDKAPEWTESPTVEFKDVSFAYNSKSGHALSDVSFRIPHRTSLAIVGSTGSGKSTITKLLTKLYDGYSGSISIDGNPINDTDPVALRAKMGIVPQDIVLLEGSIAFNIGLDRQGITREAIEDAAKAVGADAFIKELPGAYDFAVREGGANLSHGQRQVIIFARALVSHPPVLILDEATSSIDPQSEALIQNATSRLIGTRTVVVIAHRLSTIENCDQVLALERGRVVEIGKPRDLARAGGRYAELLRQGITGHHNKS